MSSDKTGMLHLNSTNAATQPSVVINLFVTTTTIMQVPVSGVAM